MFLVILCFIFSINFFKFPFYTFKRSLLAIRPLVALLVGKCILLYFYLCAYNKVYLTNLRRDSYDDRRGLVVSVSGLTTGWSLVRLSAGSCDFFISSMFLLVYVNVAW